MLREAAADIRRRLALAVERSRARTLPSRLAPLRPLLALYDRALRPQREAIVELAEAQAALLALIELLAARR